MLARRDGEAEAHDNALSILAALDERSGPSRPASAARTRVRFLFVAAALAAVAIVVLLWARMRPAEPPVAPLSVAATAMPARSSDADIGGANAGVHAADAASAAEAPKAVAALEEIAAPAVAPVVPSPAASAANLPDTPSPAPTAAPAARQAAKAASSTASKTRVAAASPRAVAKAASAAGARNTRSARRDTAGDADVDLIAALVEHMNRQPGANASSDGRAPATSIADLVARCRALGGSEAAACRRRICENYWGRAEACPRQHTATAP